jgi:hypothetical protein
MLKNRKLLKGSLRFLQKWKQVSLFSLRFLTPH